MLTHGDRVLCAVSGGIDSLTLVRVLQLWQEKVPLSYTVHGIHIDMQPQADRPGVVARKVASILEELSIPCHILAAAWRSAGDILENDQTKNICFRCARSRRTQLFSYADQYHYNKLAMGHHRDDIIETFFLNMFYAGNLSTMVPKQELFSGRLALIRPLAYLDKQEVAQLGYQLSLQEVRTVCPLFEKTSRRQVSDVLGAIERRVPEVRKNIFAALGNVRPDYLLNPKYRSAHENRS